MTKIHLNNDKKYIKRRLIVIIIICAFILLITALVYKVNAKGTPNKLKNSTNSSTDTKKAATTVVTKPVAENTVVLAAPEKTTETPETNPNINVKFNSDFFNDSVFIGDSVSKAIADYVMLKKATVVATNGQTLATADKLLGSVQTLNTKKIFILLGTNDLLNGITTEKFLSYYENLIQLLRKKVPNAKIYVQSILPVEAFAQKDKPLIANSRIDEFNKALSDMKKDSNVHFLNVASVYKNKKGNMYDGFTAEGIHIKFNYYNIWFNYLENNAK